MIFTSCPNHELIKWLLYGLMFTLVLLILFIILLKQIINNYERMLVQNKVLKRDLELNSILKHEYIQSLLCPHDLLTFNDEHLFETEKCKSCTKQCKKDCWTKYFIDKLRENKEEIENGNCN